MPTNVVIVESTSKLGGAQYDDILIQQEQQDTANYTTICFEDGDLVDKLNEMERNVVRLNLCKQLSFSFRFKNRLFLNPFAIIWRIISLPIDVIILSNRISSLDANVIVSNSMGAHILVGAASLIVKKPAVFRLMDIIRSDMLHGYGRKFFQLFCRTTKAHIVVPSKSVSTLMFEKGFIKNNVSVIYNATDCKSFNKDIIKPTLKEELDIPNDAIIFGCFSRLTPWKGHVLFINAIKKVIDKYPNVYGLIVGGDLWGDSIYTSQLKNLVSELEIDKNVIFTGFRYDIPNCISSADICVVPSIMPDPCPRIMVESMALSKPLIGSDIGGIPEVIQHNQTGIIFKSEDTYDLAKAMILFLEHPEKITEMGNAGFIRQEQLYQLSEYQQLHRELFIKLANEKSNNKNRS